MEKRAFSPAKLAEFTLGRYRRNPNMRNWEFACGNISLCDQVKKEPDGRRAAALLVGALDSVIEREDALAGSSGWADRWKMVATKERVQELEVELTPTADCLTKPAAGPSFK